MTKIGLAIHGGAGIILRSVMTSEKEELYRNALHDIVYACYGILETGGSALDAVEAAVVMLEDNPLFNAGKGSVFTHEGKIEMDASIMEGMNRMAGAVACVSNVRNPIRLARAVMDKSDHVLLCGRGAEEFGKEQGLQFEPDDYFYTTFRMEQLRQARKDSEVVLDHNFGRKMGTVGAVAVDANGSVAAATSTGGMTNKKFGRIGDSPIIGAGTYADNSTCAVSCTGHGEYFMRGLVAYDVASIMKYRNVSLKEAASTVVHEKLKPIGGDGGLIAIDSAGDIQMIFNTPGMYRACKTKGEEVYVGIYE